MTTRTNPFDTLEEMFDRMSEQFRTAARTWETGDEFEFWPTAGRTMAMDVRDDDDAFEVTIEVPGFDRDDVEVRVADDVLYVEADRATEAEVDEERYIRKERTHRTLSRSFTLPVPVEADEVTAKMHNGVLSITVPKAEPLEEGETIEIEGE